MVCFLNSRARRCAGPKTKRHREQGDGEKHYRTFDISNSAMLTYVTYTVYLLRQCSTCVQYIIICKYDVCLFHFLLKKRKTPREIKYHNIHSSLRECYSNVFVQYVSVYFYLHYCFGRVSSSFFFCVAWRFQAQRFPSAAELTLPPFTSSDLLDPSEIMPFYL